MSRAFSIHKLQPGWIEVIVGCMFSGKSEELIKQLYRARLARQSFQVYKPLIDDRYSKSDVASHSNRTFPSKPVQSAYDILTDVEKSTQVVGIDEAQFFDEEIIEVANTLANAGKRVLLAGLDTDWQGRPFGPMPHLLSIADVIHKQYAICMVCGEPATRTQRLVAAKDDILVGSQDAYEARCRLHFDPELSHRLASSRLKEGKLKEDQPRA